MIALCSLTISKIPPKNDGVATMPNGDSWLIKLPNLERHAILMYFNARSHGGDDSKKGKDSPL